MYRFEELISYLSVMNDVMKESDQNLTEILKFMCSDSMKKHPDYDKFMMKANNVFCRNNYLRYYVEEFDKQMQVFIDKMKEIRPETLVSDSKEFLEALKADALQNHSNGQFGQGDK